MRKHFLKDFTQIYHLDLHGNVRKNPKLSGTTHNVFGIQVGVGITIAIHSSQDQAKSIYYHRVPNFWRKIEKLDFLSTRGSFNKIEWIELQPDARRTWLTEGMRSEFATFLSIGMKEAKAERNRDVQTIFRNYSGGVKTNRDEWSYDFDKNRLISKIKRLIDTYNSEVGRWRRRGSRATTVDGFVTYDDTKIKWSGTLKSYLERSQYIEFSDNKTRHSLYRPFCRQWLYFERGLVERVYQFPQILPNPEVEKENNVIWLKIGSEWPMFALATNIIPDLLPQGGSQCFPYYTYAEDGSNRRENITDWALTQFQAQYGEQVTKRDIFHYVYAMLHHPQYRERYAENLKRELPRLPLLKDCAAFETCVRIGRLLMELHLNYEQAPEYALAWHENNDVPVNWYVKKMRLSADKCAIEVNEWLTLAGIPQECFQYRLGNRSALEWVIDQYQVSTDKRSGITSDPNRLEDERYIVRLVGKVVTVSVETVGLVGELARGVREEEWLLRQRSDGEFL